MTPAELVEKLRANGRLAFALKVIPKSSRDEIVGVLADGTVKLKITAAPEKGKANAAICEFLAEVFDVPRRNVEIVRGQTSSTKHVVLRS